VPTAKLLKEEQNLVFPFRSICYSTLQAPRSHPAPQFADFEDPWNSASAISYIFSKVSSAFDARMINDIMAAGAVGEPPRAARQQFLFPFSALGEPSFRIRTSFCPWISRGYPKDSGVQFN
jgi:hypothetical protein